MSGSGAGAVEAPAASPSPSTDLDERYGRRGPRSGPWPTVVAAVILAAAAVAWFVWANPIGQRSAIEWSDLAHSIDSESSATTTWRLVVTPGRTVSCAINALNTTYAIVGWRIVEVPASAESVRDLTESLRTTERANTAFVYGCWLT